MLLMKKALVAFDGSAISFKALSMGVKLSKNLGTELYIVYVAPMSEVFNPNLLGEAQFKETLESIREKGEDLRDIIGERALKALEDAREYLSSHGVKAGEVIRVGEPALEVIHAAREVGADILIVGVEAADPGSGDGFVKAVLRESPCSVLVVAPGWATLYPRGTGGEE